jgi:hypothetical protein
VGTRGLPLLERFFSGAVGSSQLPETAGVLLNALVVLKVRAEQMDGRKRNAAGRVVGADRVSLSRLATKFDGFMSVV